MVGRRIISGGTGEAIVVTKGGGRGIVNEVQGVVLVLAWRTEEGVVGLEILVKKGVECIGGLLREITMVEIDAKHTKVMLSIV